MAHKDSNIKETFRKRIQDSAKASSVREKLERGEKVTTKELMVLAQYQTEKDKGNKMLEKAISSLCEKYWDKTSRR